MFGESTTTAKEELRMHGSNWMRAGLVAALLVAVTLAAGCIVAPRAGGTPVGIGGVANGHIVGPGHRVRYPLTIPYPHNVTIFVDGHGLDPTVSLYNAAGGRLAFNDDGGGGLDAQLVVPLAPGNYIIEVAGYGSSMGPYTLTVN
jgi:hypothetical protein